ncbi:unnamed protein product [Xylocopa violacea]|uniref:Fatty acyl-CoA reductase n=1 Tax=Xylocopa violacea TaxID=135666 RepID=A0ABP1P8E9_XYLVO
MDEVRETGQSQNKTISESNYDSQIRKFYAGKVILLTGFTGFLGTIILEKLLRTCTEVSRIYIMIREKKGMTVDERLNKYFQNIVFDKLREVNPNFMEKVVPVHGDLIKIDLGLSPEDRKSIIENVNIIIHNASLVYFEAKVSRLLRINVIGTQKMLELGLECPHLEVFMYVSTAYSHHDNKRIEEKFYPPPVDLKVIQDMILADEENEAGLSKQVVNEIVGKWTNLYVFSKAIAEGVVQRFSRRTSLPCIVYRPSIIVSAYREPIPSWTGNEHGPIKLFIAAGLGMVHTTLISENISLDTIPVDFAVNNLLAVIWDYVAHRQSNKPEVYNYASSKWNPVNYKTLKDAFSKAIVELPPMSMVWYPFMVLTDNLFIFVVLHTLCHVLPAVLVDLVLIVQWKKPKAVSILLKLGKNFYMIYHFASRHWNIEADKSKDILKRMNDVDLEEFQFDLERIDWFKHVTLYANLIRNITNDTPDTIPAAKRKHRRLMVLHYTVCGLFILFSLLLLYKIACNFFY